MKAGGFVSFTANMPIFMYLMDPEGNLGFPVSCKRPVPPVETQPKVRTAQISFFIYSFVHSFTRLNIYDAKNYGALGLQQ